MGQMYKYGNLEAHLEKKAQILGATRRQKSSDMGHPIGVQQKNNNLER